MLRSERARHVPGADRISTHRLLFEWAALLVCSLAFASYSVATGLNGRLDNRILDFATSLVSAPATDDVLIVNIDEASLQAVGAWPWSREVHAQLVDRLDRAGAEQIVYDVLFVEPTEETADAALAQAISDSGKIVLPHSFVEQVNTAAPTRIPEMPLPTLAASAQAIGHVAAPLDPDGTLRRLACTEEADGKTYPHVVVAALAANSGRPAARSCASMPIVPFANYSAMPEISASQVLNGAVDEDFIRGRTVFVGASALGMGDRYVVPGLRSESMTGVRTLASDYLALRDGRLINPASKLWSLGLAALAILLLFMAFWLLDPKRGLIATISVLIGTLAFSVALVPLALVWVGPAAALISVIIAYPLWSWRRLSAVSAYLEREAERLVPATQKAPTGTGFDVVARQVDRMRSLVRDVNDSFAFMRRVIELAPDAMLVFDRAGALQMMNRRGAALFVGWEDQDENPTLQEMIAHIDAVMDLNNGELVTGSGQTFLVARAEFVAGAGEDTGEIVVFRDISQIRHREQERKQMLEFLSHDMRSPQVAIIGLADRGADGPPEKERFKRIRAQAERTLKLADDFVQIARLEEAVLQFEDADIVALIEEACDRFYAQARKAKIEIIPELPEMPIFAIVDASILARMLDNLIGNAIKYGPAGAPVSISLREIEDGGFEIHLSDKGPGLPPERLDDPFARFGAHETKAGPSAGLGLTFVKRAVELHHGSIVVQSAPGKGTRFRIAIPGVIPENQAE